MTIDWNERYESGDLPWDRGTPDHHLIEYVTNTNARGRALEVGCGTGTNALWLARRGFDVLGVDVSPRAIEQAHAKLEPGLRCRFALFDFLGSDLSEEPFDFIFDRGCFHVFDEPDQRARFAAQVAAALGPDAHWLSLIGSTEGPAREEGPPRRSLRDIADAIEPALGIGQVRSVHFEPEDPERAAGWLCLSRRRAVPAQPATRR